MKVVIIVSIILISIAYGEATSEDNCLKLPKEIEGCITEMVTQVSEAVSYI